MFKLKLRKKNVYKLRNFYHQYNYKSASTLAPYHKNMDFARASVEEHKISISRRLKHVKVLKTTPWLTLNGKF